MASKWIALAAAVLVGVGIVGCEKKDSSASSGSIKVVYIPKNTGNPYFEPLIKGVEAAATELNAEFSTAAPAQAEATSQLPIIKAQIQRGVNVLIISPNSPDALNQALKEGMKKGITVVTVDSDLTGNEDARTVGVKTVKPGDVGKGQVELLGSLIGYKGKFAILSSTTDAPNQNEWIGYMKEALKDPKYKEMELVEIVYGNDEPQKSTTETEALLTKYKDLRGIICPTSVGIVSAAQVVENAGKAEQVAVTGLGMPSQMKKFVKNGTVKAFALWSPYDEGYLAAQAGVQIAGKRIRGTAGENFTAGKLGERVIEEKGVIITGPPVVFNKDNIDQYDF